MIPSQGKLQTLGTLILQIIIMTLVLITMIIMIMLTPHELEDFIQAIPIWGITTLTIPIPIFTTITHIVMVPAFI